MKLLLIYIPKLHGVTTGNQLFNNNPKYLHTESHFVGVRHENENRNAIEAYFISNIYNLRLVNPYFQMVLWVAWYPDI